MSQLGAAAGATVAADRSLAICSVVVGQFLAFTYLFAGANPDRPLDNFDPAIRSARMIDEARDVAANGPIAAPPAVHPEDPDATLRKITFFASFALIVSYQLAGIVDDAPVLVDWLERKHAVAMQR